VFFLLLGRDSGSTRTFGSGRSVESAPACEIERRNIFSTLSLKMVQVRRATVFFLYRSKGVAPRGDRGRSGRLRLRSVFHLAAIIIFGGRGEKWALAGHHPGKDDRSSGVSAASTLLDLQLLGVRQILEGAAAACPKMGAPGLDPERGAGLELDDPPVAQPPLCLGDDDPNSVPGTAPGTKVTTSPILPTPQSWGRAVSVIETTCRRPGIIQQLSPGRNEIL